MNRICLVIIFNHQFNNNIPKLRLLYSNRFKLIRFIVPFYKGKEDDVISVFEGSHFFQGYFIQAYEKLIQCESEFFLFIGDDVLLNPNINDENAYSMFALDRKQFYIENMTQFNKKGTIHWANAMNAPKALSSKSTSWKEILPPFENALEIFKNYFGETYSQTYEDMFFEIEGIAVEDKKKEFISANGGVDVIYPLAWGYSDVVAICKESLYDFSFICGVFSAMNLFVEMAIPTSIVLTAKEKSLVSFLGTTGFNSMLDFVHNQDEVFNGIGHKMDFKISKLYDNWVSDILYIHPIKLTKWLL